MRFAGEEVLGLILLAIFYVVSIPLTIYWLINYKIVASTRHKCITSRHFNTTWAYLICCICSSNIGHPLSIILYYLHIHASTSTIVYSYILSDLSTFTVCYMCLIRCYMIMWDKKYNLALKEQFWTKKIVNDELETYEFEKQSLNDSLSPFIKYRSTLGNVKHVSIFICCFAAPITLLITISPLMLGLNMKLSSVFRFVCTIPVVSIIVFIYFSIPKYNEHIAIKVEIRGIVQIICGTFIASNLLISFLFYSVTNIINPRFLMLINGNIHIIASFLLFYTSTGFILPKLRKIIMDDLNTNAIPSQKSKLKLSVFTHSDCPSKANINSLAIPGAVWSIDPSISAEKRLKKTMQIWRRRKDMPALSTSAMSTKTKSTPNNTDPSVIQAQQSNTNELNDFSLTFDTKMRSIVSDTNRKGTDTIDTMLSLLEQSNITKEAHTSPNSETNAIVETYIQNRKNSKDETDKETNKRFELIHTPDISDGEGETDEVITHLSDADVITYSHSKNAESNTHIFTSNSTYNLSNSAAAITPQISKTSQGTNSRRTSSKYMKEYALELLNINTNQSNKTQSNKSSKVTTPVNMTPITMSHSNKNSEKRRRPSLSVKDAYASVKQIFGGHKSNISNTQSANDKIYLKICLDDPLHIVLSDEEGLSHFADHLCAEFSIENLLFIVEALQYRYAIPMYLFETECQQMSEESEINNDNCELLMHIIHQNKKLPISKLLKLHRSFCTETLEHSSPSRTMTQSTPEINADFAMGNGTHTNSHNSMANEDISRIRRRSALSLPLQSEDKCCKECIVEKFKYIIEKYIETTSINLPSAIQLKLMNIWKELQISEPQNRFIDKFRAKKPRKSSTKSEDNLEIEKVEEMDTKKTHKPKMVSMASVKNLKNVFAKQKSNEEIADEIMNTNTNTRMSKSNSLIEHTKEQIPSHSVSPRDKCGIGIMPDIDINTSNTDFPTNDPNVCSNNDSHSSPVTNEQTTTPTEIELEEPLPASPTDTTVAKILKANIKQMNEEKSECVALDSMAPTNSMQDIKGNGMDLCTDKSKEEHNNGVMHMHDGFGNINYITVFDEAILEILKLIKSDTWRRFKRSKEFVDWANDFKPS